MCVCMYLEITRSEIQCSYQDREMQIRRRAVNYYKCTFICRYYLFFNSFLCIIYFCVQGMPSYVELVELLSQKEYDPKNYAPLMTPFIEIILFHFRI